MFELSEHYRFTLEYGIWQRPEAAPFHYSDGDETEQSLCEMLRGVKNRSFFSPELHALQKDWPTTYHLSVKRANLFRPFEKKLVSGARILELGCGCGALTRYLGEQADEVCAVEGSARRGSIAALRCSDLKNVTIIVDRIQDMPEALGQFDLVTLIGVLEYARIFGGGKGAELELLRKARQFVKPGGALVLAIENKLGLKYFAGVPEDHLSVSWAGPANAYRDDGAATYSRRELLQLLNEAGFGKCEQFIPVPDYKLPVTIITEEGIAVAPDLCDLSPILAQEQRPYEECPAFNLQEGWRSVLKAGLLADLADSLCFISHVEPCSSESSHEAGVFVQHYGTIPRSLKKYAKSMAIRKTESGVRVTRRSLFPESRMEQGMYTQILDDEPYYVGTRVIEFIRQCVVRPRWTVEEMASGFAPWFMFLQRHIQPDGRLPGELLDLTPYNLIVDHKGACHAFDMEWSGQESVPFLHVLVRSVVNTFSQLGVVACPAGDADVHYGSLLKELLHVFSLDYSDEQLKEAWEAYPLDVFLFGTTLPWDTVRNYTLPVTIERLSSVASQKKELVRVSNELARTTNELEIAKHNLVQMRMN